MNIKKETQDVFCDNQPVIQSASIQAFGLMFVLDYDFKILQVSVNLETLLGLSSGQIVGKNITDFLTSEDAQLLKKEIKSGDVCHLNGWDLKLKTVSGLQPFPASFLVCEKHWIIELEISSEKVDSAGVLAARNRISALILELNQCRTVQEMSDKTAVGLKAILGVDKVMIYQFDESWNGTVLSEAKEPGMDSYLDLRFPATDIPEPARKLYALNPIRMIPDITAATVRIEPQINSATGKLTDMRMCILRSVVPVHLEYLKNMHVTTSISVSIVKNDVLWGLIAFHHRAPKTIHVVVRNALKVLSDFFSMQLTTLKSLVSKEQIVAIANFHKTLVEAVMREEAPVNVICKEIEKISRFLDAQGAAIFLDGQWFEWGAVPPREKTQQLMGWLQKTSEPVYCTDFLSQEYSEGESMKDTASGLLAISLSGQFEDSVIWFRPEVAQTVKWGGDPGKTVTFTPDGKTYHPRNSFQIWKEVVSRRSISWKASEKTAAIEIRQMLIDALLKFRSEKLKVISGILPICASCKKIRDEKNSWNVMEEYIELRSKAQFSHGLCPDCYKLARQDAGLE